MPSQFPYDIGPFWSSSKNKNTQVNVHVADKHFQIDLTPSNFETSPALLDEYLRHISHLEPDYIPETTDELGDFDDPLEEMCAWVMEPFLPLISDIPPLNFERRYTLQDCLFPETLYYTLRVVDGKLSPVQMHENCHSRFVGALLPDHPQLADDFKFPVYSPDDIHVLLPENCTALPAVPRKVSIRGQQQICFFKQVSAGDQNSTLRELNAYSKIESAKLFTSVQVPRLYGVVQDKTTGRVVGLLLSYIDCNNVTLLCAGNQPNWASHRQKWLTQITQALKSLHAHQAVWGDAKPANILLDGHDDVWLIDFGGGYTQGWVDKELANSVEGDLQALERITRYLSE